jgi:hypothetical protein
MSRKYFKENMGVSVCPFCRYSYGIECPDFLVELCGRNIKLFKRFYKIIHYVNHIKKSILII